MGSSKPLRSLPPATVHETSGFQKDDVAIESGVEPQRHDGLEVVPGIDLDRTGPNWFPHPVKRAVFGLKKDGP